MYTPEFLELEPALVRICKSTKKITSTITEINKTLLTAWINRAIKALKCLVYTVESTNVSVRVSGCEDEDCLVAATGSDHHVAVFLEDDVGAVVKVEH